MSKAQIIEVSVVGLALQYIEEHIGDEFTVADIAAYAGIGAANLGNHFRRELNTTPRAYVKRQRLHAARAMLLSPTRHWTVISIAAEFYFNHVSGFTGPYKKLFGETAGDTIARNPFPD